MMRFWKFLGTLLLALVLVTGVTAQAGAAYTYTVRIWAGDKGTINGQNVIVMTADYGDEIRLDMSTVQLKDERYYAKGIRESGKDNNTMRAVYTVTQDQDYVVAYGIRGETVSYTVRYVDAGGSELAPADTYYANVGDKPVAAYRYIEGYTPNYRNITGTLSDNAAGNVFTFTYARNMVQTVVETRVATDTNNNNTAPNYNYNPGAANNNNAAQNGTGTAGEPTIALTEDILDLDTPLAEFPGSGEKEPENPSRIIPRVPRTIVLITAGAGVTGITAGVALMMRRLRRRRLRQSRYQNRH